MMNEEQTSNPLSSFSTFSIDHGEQQESSSAVSDTKRRSSGSAVVFGTEISALCFCIPLNWVLKPNDGHELNVKNSDLSTVFLLLNYMIGSGIVVQAYVFSQSGIIVCIFEYIIISIMNYTGVNLLVRCAEETKVFDYSNLAETILGPWGSILVDVSIVVGAAGSLLSYILIIGSVLTEVVMKCSEWYCNVIFLTIIPVTLFTVPLCLLRNFGHLAVASYISITVISASVLLVIIGGPIVNENNRDHNYRMGSFIGAIKTIGDIVFALGYITATFHTYNSMKNRTIKNFNQVSLNTIIIGAIMCFFTGLIGYISFGSNTKSNIIENFDGYLGGFFKIALVIHLVLYIPGDFVIMRSAILKLCHWQLSELSDIIFISLSLFCISIITIIALLLQIYLSSTDSLAIVVDITGGIAGSMLYFIIPALCGFSLFKNNMELYWKSLILLLFGATLIILVIISSGM